MTDNIVQLLREALWLVLLLSGPPIAAASVVGLVVAFLQAATQLQEQTLTYTLKFVTVALTLFLTASMIGGSLYHFADHLFTDFPLMAHK
ncbi:MAG: type III secretion system export apparatus subunit SctS [Nevskia sp.]|nr:type III secretion system export apparatus subunit SctS [Nevskia sp.]